MPSAPLIHLLLSLSAFALSHGNPVREIVMDIVLKLRKHVCGYEGTVSSADLEEPIFLCPVNLLDSSSHLICHALSFTELPVPSVLAALTG